MKCTLGAEQFSLSFHFVVCVFLACGKDSIGGLLVVCGTQPRPPEDWAFGFYLFERSSSSSSSSSQVLRRRRRLLLSFFLSFFLSNSVQLQHLEDSDTVNALLGYFGVSIIHRSLTWVTGALTYACDFLNAYSSEGHRFML